MRRTYAPAPSEVTRRRIDAALRTGTPGPSGGSGARAMALLSLDGDVSGRQDGARAVARYAMRAAHGRALLAGHQCADGSCAATAHGADLAARDELMELLGLAPPDARERR